jgi:hypothetical protein
LINLKSRYDFALGSSQTRLRVTYGDDSYIPKMASLSNGQPYTGHASGSREIADWRGPFIDGLPDGEFHITLGDRSSGTVYFEMGVRMIDEGKAR